MRRIRLNEWIERPSGETGLRKTSGEDRAGMHGHGGSSPNKKRRRPVLKWKLMDSIIYIRMRNEYLEREGILVKVGDRRWRLRG